MSRKPTITIISIHTVHCKLSVSFPLFYRFSTPTIISCGNCVLCWMYMCESKPGWGTCWALSNISRPICCGLRKLLYCIYRRVGGGCNEPTVGTHRCVKGASIVLCFSPVSSLAFPSFFFFKNSFHSLCSSQSVHLSVCVLCRRPVIKSHCT